MRVMRCTALMVGALCVSAASSFAQPAAGSDFETVASKLDAGGSFYMVMDTRGMVERGATIVERFTSGAPEKDGVRMFPGYIRVAGKVLGFDSLEAVGASEVPFGDGGTRQKSYLLIRQPAGLFTLLGKPEGPMEIAKFAPEDAAMAAVKFVKYSTILPIVRQAASAVFGLQGTSQLESNLGKAKAEGVDIEKMLQSLSGETVLWVRLDEANKVKLGNGKDEISMARPGLVLGFRTSSPEVFNTLKALGEKKPAKLTLDKINGGEVLTAVIDENPLGWKPTFAQMDDHFFFASSSADLELAMAAAKGAGLFSSAQVTKLTEGMPADASAMGFVSPRVFTVVKDVLSQIKARTSEKDAGGMLGGVKAMLDEVLPGKDGLATWAVWDADGLLIVNQGDKVNRQFSQSGGAMLVPMMAIVVPNFLEAQVRAKVSRVRADQRSMAVAVESYFVDNNTYPVSTSELDANAPWGIKSAPGVPTLSRYSGRGGAMTLTTPIAYMTSHFKDTFAETGATFGYYTTVGDKGTNGWIVWSPGPNEKYDLDWKVYDPNQKDPLLGLAPFAYDPTNGTVSSGDIFRIKQ